MANLPGLKCNGELAERMADRDEFPPFKVCTHKILMLTDKIEDSEKYPRLANSAIYGFLYVGAEFSQQIITKKLLAKEDKEEQIDYKALGRYLLVGSLINSNYLYSWYKWLDGKYVGTHRRVIVKKVLLDQFVMTPPLYIIFYVTMSLLEGRESLLEECKKKFAKTFSISCLFWLPAQTINFLYLPHAARISYMGLCSFAWLNVLCFIKAEKPHLKD